MKLTKTKLNQLIREALTEDWRDEVADQERERVARAAMIQAEPLQSRAGRAQQLKWAAEEEERRASGLVLDADEYELIQAALGFGRQLASKGFDTPTGRGDEAIASLNKIEETLANHWEQARDDKSAIPIPSDHLKIIHRLMLYEQPLSAFNFSRYLDDAWQGYLKDIVPATRKKIKEAIAEPEPKAEPEAGPQRRSQLGSEDPDPRFAGLEFDEVLKRYKGGQSMKLTKNTLHQLIHEEFNKIKEAGRPIDWRRDEITISPDELKAAGLGAQEEPKDPSAGQAIPVEEFTWSGEELKLNSAKGEDHWSTVRTPEAFEEWKTIVLSHGRGSTVVLDKHGRWEPASGPWKEKSDAYRSGKARTLARWGSSH